MSTKVKNKKMDPHTVSQQKWELQYVAKKFGVSVEVVKTSMKQTIGGKKIGKSRKRLYNYLRAWLAN